MADLEALATLDAAGARAFDPAGFRLISALRERAETLGGGARERLRARADVRHGELAASLAAARARAETAFAALPPDTPARASLAAALASGDFAVVHRAALRHARRPVNRAEDAARLTRRAMAASHYERTCCDVFVALEVARARGAVSEAAGPYNALSLAARSLDELGALSASYLRAQVMRLEDLGALLALPPATASVRGRVRRRPR